MRPTVHGKEIRFDKNGKFIFINLGFGGYCEHNEGVGVAKRSICYSIVPTLKQTYGTLTCGKKLRKVYKEYSVLKKKYGALTDYIMFPAVNELEKHIIVDNTEMYGGEYKNFELHNTKYIFWEIGGTTAEKWRQYYGDRRKYNEGELLYMNDYQGQILSHGAFKGRVGRPNVFLDPSPFAAAWYNNFRILMEDNDAGKCVIESLKELKNSNRLIVTDELPSYLSPTFNKGLFLSDIDAIDWSELLSYS